MCEEQTLLSSLEMDAIGEIMSISMGSAATAVSSLLGYKVTMTTPVMQLVTAREFAVSQQIPAIAVDIQYINGITGSNILLLNKNDARTILSQMLETEFPEDFVIDEMAESAICELMNQMMGSSATVLSGFLDRSINISTPVTVPVDKLDEVQQSHFSESDYLLTIAFTLTMRDGVESHFVSAMRIDLAKEITDVSMSMSMAADPAPSRRTPMPIKEAEDRLRLRAGMILSWDKQDGQPLTLHLDGHLVGIGDILADEEGTKIHITEVFAD